MSNEWLKIKIVRDVKRMKKSNHSIFSRQSILSNMSLEYKNLLMLCKTKILYDYNNMKKTNNGDISLSNLNKIDFDFLLKIAKLENVIAVEMPIFTEFEIVENKILSYNTQVKDVNQNSSYDFIQQNDKYIFKIYIVEENYARWDQKEDKEYAKKLQRKRKNKLNQIESNIENEI